MVPKDFRLSVSDSITILSVLLAAVLFPDYTNLKREIQLETDLLNCTKNLNQSILIFNRVPKCASEMLWSLIDVLAHVNNFKSYSDSAQVKAKRGSENTYLRNIDERRGYANIIQGKVEDENINITYPMAYIKHLNFLDLEEFNATNPVYVNFVRHPVERVISWYYYTRQPWWQFENDFENNSTRLRRNIMNPARFKMTYTECVEKKDPECTYPVPGNTHGSFYGGSHYSQVSLKSTFQ